MGTSFTGIGGTSGATSDFTLTGANTQLTFTPIPLMRDLGGHGNMPLQPRWSAHAEVEMAVCRGTPLDTLCNGTCTQGTCDPVLGCVFTSSATCTPTPSLVPQDDDDDDDDFPAWLIVVLVFAGILTWVLVCLALLYFGGYLPNDREEEDRISRQAFVRMQDEIVL